MPPVGGVYVEVDSAMTSDLSTIAALKFHAVPSIPSTIGPVDLISSMFLYYKS
jgi:hypothetical protein